MNWTGPPNEKFQRKWQGFFQIRANDISVTQPTVSKDWLENRTEGTDSHLGKIAQWYHLCLIYQLISEGKKATIFTLTLMLVTRKEIFLVFGLINTQQSRLWPAGVVVRALDLRLRRSWGQLPALRFQGTTLGKLFTHVPLSPSSIIWYWSSGSNALASHWLCITDCSGLSTYGLKA